MGGVHTGAVADAAARGTGHVLVIDDDPDVALLARLQLELAGLRVTDADSAESGIAHARSGELDLVVLDWMLPDRDGWRSCGSCAPGPRPPRCRW